MTDYECQMSESTTTTTKSVKQEPTANRTFEHRINLREILDTKAETIHKDGEENKSDLAEKFQELKRAFKNTLKAFEESEIERAEEKKSNIVNKETLRMLELKMQECNRLEKSLNASKLELEAVKKMLQSVALKHEILLNDHEAVCAKLENLKSNQNIL